MDNLRRTIAEELAMYGSVTVVRPTSPVGRIRIRGQRPIAVALDEVAEAFDIPEALLATPSRKPGEYDREQVARDVHEALHPRWRWDDGTGACGHPACVRSQGR